jgi:hypothetical protein
MRPGRFHYARDPSPADAGFRKTSFFESRARLSRPVTILKAIKRGQRNRLPSSVDTTISLRLGDLGEVYTLYGHAADLMAAVGPGNIRVRPEGGVVVVISRVAGDDAGVVL